MNCIGREELSPYVFFYKVSTRGLSESGFVY